MQPSTKRIDSHVHFYTSQDLRRVAGTLPYTLPEPHPLTAYLDTLIDAGITPTLINNVHLSILPDSENVFASFEELKHLQATDPLRYGDVKLVGTIKAEPAYATQQRLAHHQVIGARIVLHDARPETADKVKQQAREGFDAVRDTVTKTTDHSDVDVKPEWELRAASETPADQSRGLGTS